MNKAKKLIKKIEEQQELSTANCSFYDADDGTCTTGCARAMVNVGSLCPFVSKFDSHHSSCPCFVPEGGVSDRRFFK